MRRRLDSRRDHKVYGTGLEMTGVRFALYRLSGEIYSRERERGEKQRWWALYDVSHFAVHYDSAVMEQRKAMAACKKKTSKGGWREFTAPGSRASFRTRSGVLLL